MGDWKQAVLMVLFAAKLGLAVGVLLIVINFFFALSDHIAEIGGVFALYLTIFVGAELWLRRHIHRGEYRARHRSKIRSTMEEISEVHRTWKTKLAEDYDLLFTDWVQEKRAYNDQVAPLF